MDGPCIGVCSIITHGQAQDDGGFYKMMRLIHFPVAATFGDLDAQSSH